MERLTDLDELTTRCRTASAREHIAEAIASYRGGAYRAAIVMSWIAVVFDLIDKIRALTAQGEAAAAALLATFDNYQSQIHQGNSIAMKQALEFERDLLKRVRSDLSLIDALQLSDLERLREDRHRCAHPSFNQAGEAFRPSAELARLHLLNAITHVLSQPPVQGKAALDSLQALVASTYFPLDIGKARTALEGSALANPSAKLVQSFIDQLIFGYVDPASGYHELDQTLSALTVVLDMHRGTAEPRAARQLGRVIRTASDTDMPTAAGFIASWPAGWALLAQAERDKIAEFVLYADFADIEPLMPGLAQIEGLHASVRERLGKLTTPKLERLIAEEGMAPLLADAAVAKYLASGSFDMARGRRRRLIMPLLDQLNGTHVAAIITGAGANDQVRDENYFPSLLERLRGKNVMPGEQFDGLAAAAGLAELLEDAGRDTS